MIDNEGNECDIAKAIDYKDFKGMVYSKLLRVDGTTYYFHYWTVVLNKAPHYHDEGLSFEERCEVKIVFKEEGIRSYTRICSPQHAWHNKYPDRWVANSAGPLIDGMMDYVVTKEAEKAIFGTETNSILE